MTVNWNIDHHGTRKTALAYDGSSDKHIAEVQMRPFPETGCYGWYILVPASATTRADKISGAEDTFQEAMLAAQRMLTAHRVA